MSLLPRFRELLKRDRSTKLPPAHPLQSKSSPASPKLTYSQIPSPSNAFSKLHRSRTQSQNEKDSYQNGAFPAIYKAIVPANLPFPHTCRCKKNEKSPTVQQAKEVLLPTRLFTCVRCRFSSVKSLKYQDLSVRHNQSIEIGGFLGLKVARESPENKAPCSSYKFGLYVSLCSPVGE
jgi:hypothetical protein